ncbi:MAG: RnfABCDGE type electron transport complex subunit D [Oscillospiraceae bacterium]
MSQTESETRRLTVASPPHIATADTVHGTMRDVLIALVPALAVSVYFFGIQALLLAVTCVAACVLSEWGYCALLKKQPTVGDLSAAVTGLLLAMCLPVTMPLYWAALAGVFAAVVAKGLFGGLGKNLFNPALSGRALLVVFPALLSAFQVPGVSHWVTPGFAVDAVTAATPLLALKDGTIPIEWSLRDLLLGQRGGSMGEVAAFALLLGGVYLCMRGVISLRIPLSFVGTVALCTLLSAPAGSDPLDWMLYELLTGGLLLGAIFMATDPVTTPVTRWGQVLFGVGCGGITVLMRYFSPYPEGVATAILVMNAAVWLLDTLCAPRRFGRNGHLIQRLCSTKLGQALGRLKRKGAVQ